MKKPSAQLKAWLVEKAGCPSTADDSLFCQYAVDAMSDGKLSADILAGLQAGKSIDMPASKTPDPMAVFSKGGTVRVKDASETYSATKAVGKHRKTGLPVKDERGEQVQTPSQLEFAKAGAYYKMLAIRSGLQQYQGLALTDHDRQLLDESFAKDVWVGEVNGGWSDQIPGQYVKTLLSDNTSGGLQANPVWWDSAVIQFPLLYGELYPYVDLVEMPRGVTIQSASVSNPSVTWGTAEGTSLTLFDTTSLVGALGGTVYPVMVGVTVGRDLLADSPANLGQILTENIGQRMAHELDKVIVSGDGTTQPQGITNASGLAVVHSTNGTAGPPTVSDYESLMFGLPKQYRTAAMRPGFISTDVSYQRARGVAINASDQRRVFGMDEGSYNLLSWPVHIQQDLANGTLIYGALSRYRMWRRQGFETRFSDIGQTLMLANEALLVVRGRFAGKVVDANAFVKMTDAQS